LDKRSSFQTLEIKTTWGTITLTLNGDQVVALDLPYLKNTPHKPFAIEKLPLSSVTASHLRGLSRSARIQALEDLLKKFPNIGKPLGTKFQMAVWNELKKIPRGQTRTYGEIAAAIGRPKAARAVGSACGANPLPLFIPCHRVVAKNGLGGFRSGLPWKKLLLKNEGWIELKVLS